jgi:hypothetical protein
LIDPSPTLDRNPMAERHRVHGPVVPAIPSPTVIEHLAATTVTSAAPTPNADLDRAVPDVTGGRPVDHHVTAARPDATTRTGLPAKVTPRTFRHDLPGRTTGGAPITRHDRREATRATTRRRVIAVRACRREIDRRSERVRNVPVS